MSKKVGNNDIIYHIGREYGYFVDDWLECFKIEALYNTRSDTTDLREIWSNKCQCNGCQYICGYSSAFSSFAGYLIIIPLFLISSIYSTLIYPMIIYLMYIHRNIDNDYFFSKQYSQIFWFLSVYWILMIIMIYFTVAFIRFFYVWWHCLFWVNENRVPCMQIAGFYEYIHLHRARIDIIKTFFGPLANVMLQYLGYQHQNVMKQQNKEFEVLTVDHNDNGLQHNVDILPQPKDLKNTLTENNYIATSWKYKDFFGYKRTVINIQNNKSVNDFKRFLFQ